MSKEEREEQLARELAKLLGADSDDFSEIGGFEDADSEVAGALDVAMSVLGAYGNVPELKPEFDSTLRARLVRQAAGGKRKKSPIPLMKWRGLAVAAVFMVLFIPTVVMMRERFAMESKIEALEKYDKMYVPYSEKVKRGEMEVYRVEPFSEGYRNKVRDMALNAARRRTAEYFESYRHERR